MPHPPCGWRNSRRGPSAGATRVRSRRRPDGMSATWICALREAGVFLLGDQAALLFVGFGDELGVAMPVAVVSAPGRVHEQAGAAEDRFGLEQRARDREHVRIGDGVHERREIRRVLAEVRRMVEVAHAGGVRPASLSGNGVACAPAREDALAGRAQECHPPWREQARDDHVAMLEPASPAAAGASSSRSSHPRSSRRHRPWCPPPGASSCRAALQERRVGGSAASQNGLNPSMKRSHTARVGGARPSRWPGSRNHGWLVK